jgi:hypothetical protein
LIADEFPPFVKKFLVALLMSLLWSQTTTTPVQALIVIRDRGMKHLIGYPMDRKWPQAFTSMIIAIFREKSYPLFEIIIV